MDLGLPSRTTELNSMLSGIGMISSGTKGTEQVLVEFPERSHRQRHQHVEPECCPKRVLRQLYVATAAGPYRSDRKILFRERLSDPSSRDGTRGARFTRGLFGYVEK